MTQQWLRSYSLSVSGASGNVSISSMSGEPGLRVRFQIKQSDVQSPNTAIITVTNLSEATAASLVQNEFDQVTLQVGYQDGLQTLFQGEIVQKRKGRETPVETYLQIIGKNGSKPYSYATMSKTLAAGHTFKDQVNACLEALKPFGVTAGFIDDLGSAKMPSGRTMFGMVREQLRQIARSTGTSWSIQDNNKLQIVKNNGFVPSNVTVLNSLSGLIGMPIQTINGVEARCLLNPQIKPGGLIQIDQKSVQTATLSTAYQAQAQNQVLQSISVAADGIYRVLRIDHEGDSRGTDWYSDIHCMAAASNFIPPGEAARGTTIPTGQ